MNLATAQLAKTQPATPGSYGLYPTGFRLPEDIRLGPVRLQVADLERSIEYYQRVIGLTLLEQDGDRAMLGAPPSIELVELRERRGARPAPARGRAGLYHFAILLPDRPSLGRFARHLNEKGERAGSSDHLVSEAFYLRDPDHLGIEVYADRPRSAWRRNGRELILVTGPLKLEDLLNAGGDQPWNGVPEGTVMGHVHLHVAELRRAETFFMDALGFDRMAHIPSGVTFMGAGGYHHHLATNTWAGRGVPFPEPDQAQLLEWTIRVGYSANLAGAAASLSRHGLAYQLEPGVSLRVHDPSGATVRMVVDPS